MPELTDFDEHLVHQIPEPFPNVATFHEHWRESYFFVLHRRDKPGDVVVLTMATYPRREILDSFQMGTIRGRHVFALHTRPYDGDPHTPVAGPVRIEIVEPYSEVRLRVDADGSSSHVGLDLTFRARTRAYGLRRGTMKAGHEVIWDQAHMIQSGDYDGWYSLAGDTHEVDGWWGQRDHSWGIRDHRRCPFWMWLAIQLPDGMFGVWCWELANGARIYTDGCFAPTGGGDPVPVVDFRHALEWIDPDGKPADYGRDGHGVAGLRGSVDITLAGGKHVRIDGEGRWSAPYGPLGGGQIQMEVRTSDGRVGIGVYELTGAHHHRYFPVPRADDLPA